MQYLVMTLCLPVREGLERTWLAHLVVFTLQVQDKCRISAGWVHYYSFISTAAGCLYGCCSTKLILCSLRSPCPLGSTDTRLPSWVPPQPKSRACKHENDSICTQSVHRYYILSGVRLTTIQYLGIRKAEGVVVYVNMIGLIVKRRGPAPQL